VDFVVAGCVERGSLESSGRAIFGLDCVVSAQDDFRVP